MPIDAQSITWDEPKGITWDDEKPKKGQLPASTRFVAGLMDPIQGGAQLLENSVRAISPAAVDAINKLNNKLADWGMVGRLPAGGVQQQTQEREAALKTDGIDWARFGGNVLSPVNAAFAAGLPAAATTAARVGSGAGLGAVSAALMPSSGAPQEKLTQMGLGSIGGAAVPAAVAGLGRVVSPNASTSADLKLLIDAGVKPTVGQTLGGRWNAAEEKLQSLPLMGDMITRARSKAQEQFNQAAIDRVGASIGVKSQGAGQEAVAKMGNAASDAYEAAKSAIGHFQIDQQGKTELVNLRNMVGNLPEKEQKAFRGIWDYLRGEVSPNGSITGEGFKRIDSKIGKEAARFGGSGDGYQAQLGDALSELKRIITDNAKRSNPKAAEMFSQADKAWANLVRIEGASKAAMNNGGVFTPAQLQMAVRQADKSTRDRATARGEALMQDLSGAGQSVLGNKVPNSGTVERAALGIGGLASYMVDPLIPASLLGGGLAYTNPAQSLLRGLVSSRPQLAQPVAGLLNRTSPMLSPAGGLLALDAIE